MRGEGLERGWRGHSVRRLDLKIGFRTTRTVMMRVVTGTPPLKG